MLVYWLIYLCYGNPWGWHLGAETCSRWCVSHMVYYGVRLLMRHI